MFGQPYRKGNTKGIYQETEYLLHHGKDIPPKKVCENAYHIGCSRIAETAGKAEYRICTHKAADICHTVVNTRV